MTRTQNAAFKLPDPTFDPPFRVTRASHVTLEVGDLARAAVFYTEVAGMVITAEEGDALYLRGIEEACHHSLVLRRSDGRACGRVGFRVQRDRDLDLARDHFATVGCETAWADVPHQGRTLHVTDPGGVAMEYCASMDVVERRLVAFRGQRGGRALRLDHVQILTPRVADQCLFYMALGFRVSEYIVDEEGEPTAVFMQCKGNSHDLVFVRGVGPRLHHFAIVSPDSQTIVQACDVAGEIGYGACVERGPGRHGPGHDLYVYLRDPDGHRVELCNTTYQTMDVELEPVRWSRDRTAVVAQWGLPAQRSWFDEATPFTGAALEVPVPPPDPVTLERFLAGKSPGRG